MVDDRTDFTAFVRGRSPALMRSAVLLTGDSHQAEELLQVSLAKAYLAWGRIREQDAAEAYVRRIMVTTNISTWRKVRARLITGTMDREPSEEPGTDIETRMDMWSTLRTLPTRQRTVIVLRYYEDLTEAATAQAMGCSIGTVKRYHARALSSLRSTFSPEGSHQLGEAVT